MANPYNSVKTGSVASRFVSSNELSDAQKKREAELKEAYERIGQEPPPEPAKEEYDPRSLYERLKANKDAKQEKFDETWKLSNQFRGIDEGESDFLADIAKEKREQERLKLEEERQQLEDFRRAHRSGATAPSRPHSEALSPPSSSSLSKQQSQTSSSKSPDPEPSSKTTAAGIKRPPPSSDSKPSKSSKKKRDGSMFGIRRKTDTAAKSKQSEAPVSSITKAEADACSSSEKKKDGTETLKASDTDSNPKAGPDVKASNKPAKPAQ
ncbi:unnamed protein product [Sympodiomycopsis kandeliae]